MKKINFILALFIINISAFAQQALWGQQNIVSPEIHENNTVTFRLKAPKAIKVEVTGDFLPAGKNGEAGKASLYILHTDEKLVGRKIVKINENGAEVRVII